MKRFFALLLCLCVLCLTACMPQEPAAPPTPPPADEDEGLRYQAHRGYSYIYPENTMPAFEGAIAAGFRLIELDPNFTKDGQCVLMHDSTINRTCRNANGTQISASTAIRSLTYQELLQYDAGIFKGEAFRGTKVPLLSEVAELVKDTKVILKIDNKIHNSAFSDAEREVIYQLAEQHPDNISITCKTVEQVQSVIARLPDAIIQYDGTISEEICQELREIVGDNELYIWYKYWDAKDHPEVCEMIKAYGYLGIWDVVKEWAEEALSAAIALGADVVETNGEVAPPPAA